MPIEYELLKNGTIVMARASGVVTLECFLSTQEKMKADKNLNYPFDSLLDGRFVEKLEITEDDLKIIAQGLTSGSRKLGAQKLAIVTNTDYAFDLGKKYGEMDKGVTGSVIIFYNIEIAKKWLNIENE